MIASRITGRKRLIAAGALVAVVAVGGVAVMSGGGAAPSQTPTPAPASGATTSGATGAIALGSAPGPTPTPLIVPGTLTPEPTPEATPSPTFPALDLLVTPSPAPARGALPTDPSSTIDSRRPLPVQSTTWLTLKASGRISLSGGGITLLPPGSDPLVNPSTGLPVPAKAMLDTSWTRWIVEPPGYGYDEKGNHYSNLSYWNLCGDGAMAATLWYWQQLTGDPDVTGTAGYFLDPYASEAVAWPSPGPTVAVSGGTRVGTYWSGSDAVSGFTAHGRGFVMYLAMQSQPASWNSAGLSVFARNGQPLYPTSGTPRTNIQTGLNWEVSGRNPTDWTEAFYASVIRPDPTLARDLTAAVMLDVGRDGVPVVGAVDAYGLPNWQAGSATPHTRHAIAIVGYDNTANPPTFTYIDTCGRSCNNRGGNQNGQLHVISQAQMVVSIQARVGSGFVW